MTKKFYNVKNMNIWDLATTIIIDDSETDMKEIEKRLSSLSKKRVDVGTELYKVTKWRKFNIYESMIQLRSNLLYGAETEIIIWGRNGENYLQSPEEIEEIHTEKESETQTRMKKGMTQYPGEYSQGKLCKGPIEMMLIKRKFNKNVVSLTWNPMRVENISYM